ncbi:exoribonuclease 2 [Coniochaeta sp. 2T2.1]|nr:exoribonuclease 2 [Coniochaeta sp. 2T2.1]
MGIPAAFRWLSTKYPKIISPVVEEQPVVMEDGTVIPVDGTRPNPNGEEFDNLYLDMNGIVHPCSHPEDRPAPKDEEEMMVEIFKYTDRVVNMVRPRKLLMIAVDGVAPRAKMNQQRSRRFRAAQEAQEKEEDKQELLKMLKKQNGGIVKEESVEEVVKKAFDSNSITPGTPFMDILAASLRYWCAYKLNTDPAWAKMKVIISDATVPGEGEHKIMNFVRSQRSSPEHDPNTRHVIYGLDADLIMLGLATHEPHFRVLREDVFAQQSGPRLCKICGQKGHDARACQGEAKPFIWLHVSVLREYLAVELNIPDLPFRFDLERAIDDWVFMCFFVGNDFLPHLPALEIRENGIDTLMAIWKDNLPYMGGYVTKDGHVDLERAQYIMNGLAKQEAAIFRRRKETEDRREASFKRRKLQEQQGNSRGGYNNGPKNQGRSRTRHPDFNAPSAADVALIPVTSLNRFPSILKEHVTHDMVVNKGAVQQANVANKSAASTTMTTPSPASATTSPASALGKRKAELIEDDDSTTPGTSALDSPTPTPASDADTGPVDTVRLWEEGYADRYYEQKFHVDPKDTEFRHKVARAYVEGLAWVLMYYFQGCPSWEWYYPYHYAPFAEDFVDLGKMTISFEKGRISRPFEQLMSVLPAASRHSLPEVFHDLMLNPDSEIIDFYPEDFEVDLNGKKMAWQGVALLPFIEMPRLLSAVEKKYPLLSEEDTARNTMGKDVLLLSDAHPELYDEITINFYSKKQGVTKFKLNPAKSDGLSGTVEKIEGYIPHGSLVYPLQRNAMPDVEYDRSLSVNYEMPTSIHQNKSMLLRGVKMPAPTLDGTDVAILKGKGQRSGRSFGGVPLDGRNNYNNRGGGRGGQFNYGPGGQRPRQDRLDRGGYGQSAGNGYQGRDSYQAPPPSWQPPPPGVAGFGIGMPPPPPPAYVQGGGNYSNNYGQNYGQGYGQNQYGAAPPAPPPGLDSRQQQYGGPQRQNGYQQRPYGNDRGRGYQGPRDYR